MDLKIRVGVIGAGHMGSHHVRNYCTQPDVELTAVVDKDKNRLNQMENDYFVKGYSHYDSIMHTVDAVSIATPTSTHYKIARDFIEAGKHVLLEKPITAELHEAKALIELANKQGVVFAIGHIERFSPVIAELEKITRHQKLLFIEIHREGPFDPKIFDADVAADLMIHDVDLLLHLFKGKISLLSAYGVKVHSTKNDIVNAQFVSDGGILINVISSRVAHSKLRQWKITTPDQMIEVDFLKKEISTTTRNEVELIQITHLNTLLVEQSDFLVAIRMGTAPKVTGEQGYLALKFIKEIQNSALKTMIRIKPSNLNATGGNIS